MLPAVIRSQHSVSETPLGEATFGSEMAETRRRDLGRILEIFDNNCPSSLERANLSRFGDHLIFDLRARLSPSPDELKQFEDLLAANDCNFTIELRLIQGWPSERRSRHRHKSELVPDGDVKSIVSPQAAWLEREYNRSRLDAELPAGVTILRQQVLSYTGKERTASFVVLDVSAPEKLLPQLTKWAIEFRERSGITIILQPDTGLARAREDFRSIAGAGLRLTHAHSSELEQLVQNFHGCAAPTPREAPPDHTIESSLKINQNKFTCIDSTNVQFREDAFAVERLANGVLRVSVAFPDLTWFMQPHDAIDRYHQRAGFSVYGNGKVIPALGGYSAPGYGSFATAIPQPAWVIQFDINKQGDVSNELIERQIVTIDRAIDFSSADIELSSAAHSELNDAYRASKRLRNPRLQNAQFVRSESANSTENHSRVLIEELIIQAKHLVASWLDDAQIPAGFRVYQAPNQEEKFVLFDRLRELGINVIRPQSFTSEEFLNSLVKLQEKGELSLISDLVDAFVYRRHYAIFPGEHFGLGIHPYTEMKSRDAISFPVQWNLRAKLSQDVMPISAEEMRERVSYHNERSRQQPNETLRLINASMISEKLGFSGRTFEGVIAKIEFEANEQAKILHVDLGPWFKRFGRIELNDIMLKAAGLKRKHQFSIGDRVWITLKDFDLESEQFNFDLRSDFARG